MLVSGTTTVSPLEMMVVEEIGGHDVVEHCRSVWQHPPPADAWQA
jgi:hypothetical protein